MYFIATLGRMHPADELPSPLKCLMLLLARDLMTRSTLLHVGEGRAEGGRCCSTRDLTSASSLSLSSRITAQQRAASTSRATLHLLVSRLAIPLLSVVWRVLRC